MTAERMVVVGRTAGIVLFAVIVQAGVVASLSMFGVRPELTLLLAVSAGVAAGPDRGAVVGFCLGLAYDVFLQTPLGLSACIYALIAFAAGSVQLKMATHRRLARMLSVGVGSAVGVVCWALIGRLLDLLAVTWTSTLRVALVVGIVNGLLGPSAVRLWSWVFVPEEPLRVPG